MADLEMELRRTHINIATPNGIGTFGELHVMDSLYNGYASMYTCEDMVRDYAKDIADVKVSKETAIPMGVYEVVVTMSPKFKRFLPLLLNVENFTGVRIHSGATPKHTDGCLLVGTRIQWSRYFPVRLLDGEKAEALLMSKLGKVVGNRFEPFYNKMFLTVVIDDDAIWN